MIADDHQNIRGLCLRTQPPNCICLAALYDALGHDLPPLHPPCHGPVSAWQNSHRTSHPRLVHNTAVRNATAGSPSPTLVAPPAGRSPLPPTFRLQAVRNDRQRTLKQKSPCSA